MQVEVVALNTRPGDGGGGRPAVRCCGCGRATYRLFVNPAVRLAPWEARPEPWEPKHPVGFRTLPDFPLDLAKLGERPALSWLCRWCCGALGHISRSAPLQRLRHVVASLSSRPTDRRGRFDTYAEVERRKQRLVKARRKLAKLERRAAKSFAEKLAEAEAASH